MGLFGKKNDEKDAIAEPVKTTGTISGLTRLKKRGFIRETGTSDSVFFSSDACSDFDQLNIGQNVAFTKEVDPKDRLRKHAVDVRPA